MQLAYAHFYGLDQSSDAGPGFTVRAMNADPNRIVEPHVHEGAHAVAVLGGVYRSLASPDVPLHVGDIVFNPHGVEHADSFDGAQGRFLTVSYDPGLYPAQKGETRLPTTLAHTNALAAVYAIIRHLRSPEAPDSQALEAAVLHIAHCAAPPSFETKRRPPGWATRARDRLVSGEAELTVAHLASEQGMHPVAFARTFRRYFGKAPLAFGLEARLRSSAQDLARGKLPISEIGLKWGFCDQAHFSRQFRLHFGASPGQFRRTIQS